MNVAAQAILDPLNPEQKEAVLSTEGPLLILAGAGSGKTRVLTHRIAYLIEGCGIDPRSILAVTFTNKAAHEMKERVRKILMHGSEQDQLPPATEEKAIVMPTMGTFHAICAQILRRDIHLLGRASTFVIFDTVDQVSIIRQIMKEVAPQAQFSPRAILEKISQTKNERLTFNQAAAKFAGDFFGDTVLKVLPKYTERLKDNEALDFDDLLTLTVDLLQTKPAVLEKYQNLWHYVLIDEYQDTNYVQYLMTGLLAGKHRNLCVVGDDDQSIYGFRGADVRNILAFERDYPDAKVVKLEQNYRSTQVVLDAAFEVISQNQNRTDKRLWTDREGGDQITVYEALNETDEASHVVDEIETAKEQGQNLSEVAILYRTNAQSRAFEEACILRGIPYRLIGGVKFYERKEIKDLLAFLRLIHNHEDQLGFERIVNVPPRGIGHTTLKEFLLMAKEAKSLQLALLSLQEDPARLGSRGAKSLLGFATLLGSWRDYNTKHNILELFDRVLEDTDYLAYLNDGSSSAEERFENVQELRNTIATYSEYGAVAGLSVFLEDVALLTDLDRANYEKEAVTLITMHAVKGLEFGRVFLTGLEEGLFPHSRSLENAKDLEEERRLCYVGITRAKHHLQLSYANNRAMWGETRPTIPSRFLLDIPKHLVTKSSFEDSYSQPTPTSHRVSQASAALQGSKASSQFAEGEKVLHTTFGEGVIVQIKGQELPVVFKKGGLKRLLEGIAPLKSLS